MWFLKNNLKVLYSNLYNTNAPGMFRGLLLHFRHKKEPRRGLRGSGLIAVFFCYISIGAIDGDGGGVFVPKDIFVDVVPLCFRAVKANCF